MQMMSKVIRLDLNYASETSRVYQQRTCYIAPYKEELVEHFALRLLAYLSLFEDSPQLAKSQSSGKKPDLYIIDDTEHIKLWCNVDVLSEKHLQRASHLADQVVLFLDENEQRKVRSHFTQHLTNVLLHSLNHQQLLECCLMLKGHMRLDLWREGETLLITDRLHLVEMATLSLNQLQH